MATSTEQLTDLIAQVVALQTYIQGQYEIDLAKYDTLRGDIHDLLAAEFWVDQINGDDEAGGGETAPLATISEAASRVPVGSQVKIRLVGDYQMINTVFLKGCEWTIRSADFGNPSRLTFAGESTNKPGQMPAFDASTAPNSSIYFNQVTIELGTAGAGVGTRHVVGAYTHVSVMINNCEVVVAASSDQNVIEWSAACSIVTKGVTFSGDGSIAGRWRGDLAAGTDPATVESIGFTNLNSL